MAAKKVPDIKVGEVFGQRTVISEPFKIAGNKMWKVRCLCSCGTEADVNTLELLKNRQTMCWDCRCRSLRSPDIHIGLRFGKFTVVGETKAYGKLVWVCECACGNKTNMNSAAVHSGRKECPKCAGLSRRLGDVKIMWSGIVHRAKTLKVPLEVTWDELKDLLSAQNYQCALSGIPIALPKSSEEFYNGVTTASVDRIDSTIGYVPGNVQWVHKDVNFMKQSFPQSYRK
jgi:hypothetical protein